LKKSCVNLRVSHRSRETHTGIATPLRAHNEGWVHFRESQAELTATFAQFGLANRLAVFERGIPIRFPIAAASVSMKAMGVRHN